MTLPPVLRATHVPLPAEDAFRLFTDEIGAWWPLQSHAVLGAATTGVAFEEGALVERSLTGERAVWGEVLVWDAPHRVSLTWHPGRDTGTPASQVEITFRPDEDGTRVELAHSGWEALGEAAAATRSNYAGRNAWGHVLDHFTDLAEAGGTASRDEALSSLAAAYESFFAEALAGGFDPPADGGFTAEQVVAHIVVNDDALAAICRRVIDGAGHADGVRSPARLENEEVNDRAVLQSFVDAHGGNLPAMVAEGRRRARQFRLLLARLDEAEREVPVHARLLSDGEVMLDDDVPWARLALMVQATRHLPGHTEQLRALRPART